MPLFLMVFLKSLNEPLLLLKEKKKKLEVARAQALFAVQDLPEPAAAPGELTLAGLWMLTHNI